MICCCSLHKVPPFQWFWPAIGGFVPAPQSISNWICLWIGVCQLKPPSHSTVLNKKQMVTPVKQIKTLWVGLLQSHTLTLHAHVRACVCVCVWAITLLFFLTCWNNDKLFVSMHDLLFDKADYKSSYVQSTIQTRQYIFITFSLLCPWKWVSQWTHYIQAFTGAIMKKFSNISL